MRNSGVPTLRKATFLDPFPSYAYQVCKGNRHRFKKYWKHQLIRQYRRKLKGMLQHEDDNLGQE